MRSSAFRPRSAGAAPRRTSSRPETGAAAVEFALVFPILLVLVFGLVQYGFYFWAMQGASSAAREAARLASVGEPVSCNDFRSRVTQNIDGMRSNTPTITRDFSSTGAVQEGDEVTVTVVFQAFNFNMPFVPFVNDGIVTQQATSRVDYVPATAITDCP